MVTRRDASPFSSTGRWGVRRTPDRGRCKWFLRYAQRLGLIRCLCKWCGLIDPRLVAVGRKGSLL